MPMKISQQYLISSLVIVLSASMLIVSLTALVYANTQISSFPSQGELDCNGDSSVQAAIALNLNCLQPLGPYGVFKDNGWYVGHDEPGMRFISSAPGSGNSMIYNLILPKSPTSSHGVRFFEDAAAPWFGMNICDTKSFPQQPCTPDSDSNTGTGQLPTDAGNAYLELQFYPPGFPNFYAADSCDLVHWCSALSIDSLECNFLYAFCNPACTEPVNFAFLTKDGVPIGPPSPQLATKETFDTPQNPDVLLMNPGDHLQVVIHDSASGLFTQVNDLTLGKSGFMVASAANGFMQTNLHTCTGTPYDFHPEYSTAQREKFSPWGPSQFGVMADVDGVGHFEVKDGDADDTYCLRGPPGLGLGTVCLSEDLDFDGFSYQPTGWPTTIFATAGNAEPWTLLDTVPGMLGPSSGGHGYPTIELETDIGFSMPPPVTSCNMLLPNQCGIPNQYSYDFVPTYAGFYPFFSEGTSGALTCQVYFGDVSGPGIFTFGGQAGYGNTLPSYIGTQAVYGIDGAFYPNTC